ncbi:alpha/beta hydrolase family protein [Winogradskyella psychrotolerans]|uniref:alpha/beta hydrolase family protein n=1 Tax=Winogradskyella psychrotolerans TaxID=1344585 RepID=UPI001C06808E|nr:prolyl oligopeptidase family serine peptidase [Winogradskyella psychrotolerans]MBU2929882.1 acetylxylan esterase [Winogradskyella psychrotolerans]
MSTHIILKSIHLKSIFGIIWLLFCTTFFGQNKEAPLYTILESKVFEVPEIFWEPSKDQGDIKALFYKTLDYKGKPTRAFAFLGIPKSDQPVPAMILVHGGGGRAFHEWVKIWNDKGYAAIAMSLEGYRPDETGSGKFTHEYSGPQRVGRFDDIELPLKEQWMYHAVSDILLAHSLLEDMPEIDANAIGITGISWGGVLSSLVSGIDDRLKCAIPVYGAGFLYESKGHFGEYSGNNPELEEKKKFWDPAHQFTVGSVPTLWVNGDSDAHFSLNITSHSFEVTEDHAFMSVHPSMRHGHPPGWKPNEVPEIYAFADYMLKGKGFPLGQIIKQPIGRKIKIKYISEVPLTEATVYYLNEELTYRKIPKDAKHPQPNDWQKMAATINAKKHTVKAKLPKEIKTYYVNLKDERGLIISSKLVQL